MTTGIQWTDETWNPVTGCTKVSAGCKHCYAETVADRFWAKQYPDVEIETNGPGGTITRSRQFTDVMTHEDRLLAPVSWRKPRRVFVNSMSDLFHEDVPDVFIERVFSVMAQAERHTFQVLTKRPARMLAWFRARRFDVKDYAILQTENPGECRYAWPWPLPNVWLGVSCENQETANERIPLLLQTPAAVRFISAEPLLGPIDLTHVTAGPLCPQRPDHIVDVLRAGTWVLRSGLVPVGQPDFINHSDMERLDWVIVGGESGPKSRPCALEWIQSIVRQCTAADKPVFVKQLGGYVVSEDRAADSPATMRDLLGPHAVWPEHRWLWRAGLADRKGGDLGEWPEDLRVRQWPGEESSRA